MSEDETREKRVPGETEGEDDVEAHKRVPAATDEGDGDDVEAHKRVPAATDEGEADDVEGHMRVNP